MLCGPTHGARELRAVALHAGGASLGCNGPSKWWSEAMGRSGCGDWSRSTFRGRCRSWISGMRQPHLWEVARVVYGRSTPEGIAWARQACSWLVHGEIETLVTFIEALPPVAPPPGQTRSVPEQAVGNFTTNAQRMRYPHFRAQGMHVGSGMAEAACKTVVSTRAKRAGMRLPSKGVRRPFAFAHRCSQSHLRCLLARSLCCPVLIS